MHESIVRNFYVSSALRDKVKYPHPSSFTYTLPATLTNVRGVAVRTYKFGKERLVNENNKRVRIVIDGNAVDGYITLTTGDFGNDINNLLSEMNSKLVAYGIQFSVDENTGRVTLVFTDNFVQSYVSLSESTLFKTLGFEFDGMLLYRNGATLPAQVPGKAYNTIATAENPYDVYNVSDVVLRINDVEAIMSEDAITNRSTMILFSDKDPNYTLRDTCSTYYPLLQVQHRLKALQITLLNLKGDLYDAWNSDVSFMIEFHCDASMM